MLGRAFVSFLPVLWGIPAGGSAKYRPFSPSITLIRVLPATLAPGKRSILTPVVSPFFTSTKSGNFSPGTRPKAARDLSIEMRSEERRVGKECRSRRLRYYEHKE